jgi:hypothetical protein
VNVSEVKAYQHREVILRLDDGDVIRAKLAHVDEEYQDVVVEVVESTQPEHYQTPGALYAIALGKILTIAPYDGK